MFARIAIKFDAGDPESYSGVVVFWGKKKRTWKTKNPLLDFRLARKFSQDMLENNNVVTGLLIDSSVSSFCKTFTDYKFQKSTNTLKKI